MSWFAELAGRAENLLNNLDEQTGEVLRNNNVVRQKKNDRRDVREISYNDPNWAQKKRPPSRFGRRSPPPSAVQEAKPLSNISLRRLSPVKSSIRNQYKEISNCDRNSPQSSKNQDLLHYPLDHCPKTLIDDPRHNELYVAQYSMNERRRSLPSDLELISKDTYRVQNLEVENAMLRNELNVMNSEVSELINRLNNTEDGNNISNSRKELNKIHTKLEVTQSLNEKINEDKFSLSSQLELLKQRIYEVTNVELVDLNGKNQQLATAVALLTTKNTELEEELNKQKENSQTYMTANGKLENELRHSQSTTNELRNELDKTKGECVRLEKEWEAYKVRVKSMLHSKDEEIRSLQDGLNLSEETKDILEQLEQLKQERESLAEDVSRVRNESEEMKHYMEQLQTRNNNAERVVVALRDALRDERAAKNKAESQCIAIGKELKAMQIETGQTIASLRTALRDKESEVNHLRESSSTSVPTADTSALNVADYDVTSDTANEQVQYLTQMLVQKQEKVDKLMAEGNILRIQMDKLESKYNSEVSSLRAANSHSVVNLHEEHRPRSRQKYTPESAMSILSLRIGILLKRYPIFRVFIAVYMVFLHFWVMTVLFTSTPDDYTKKPLKT